MSRSTTMMMLAGATVLVAAVSGACSVLPPGVDYPRTASVALADPEETRLGRQFTAMAGDHAGNSGYRLITVGVDGFLARVQMIDAAERTLDLQYYIYRGDETGQLINAALVRAADRGVRVRVLVDDGDTIAGDEKVAALHAHPRIEVRIFNPFAYRGHLQALRFIEFMFNASRLDYRMHNKLLVVDNSVALVGGRNIGNQYFQMDPETQFADDDVFAAGPVTVQLSATFDEYWNSGLAIPAEALRHPARTAARLTRRATPVRFEAVDYSARIASGEPYAGMLAGRLPLVWTHAKVVCDSPNKKHVRSGARPGRLMTEPIADATGAVQSELLLVTPYLVPASSEMSLLGVLQQRHVRVRILTNSLESAPEAAAQSGYVKYRVPLLRSGVELYEVRSLLGSARGSGQTAALSRHGTYALHAKMFVFDRQQLFAGSMNFDQRSLRLNTEVGLIIDSPELATQTAGRFEAMVRPENAYAVALLPRTHGGRPSLVWHTHESGQAVDYTREPARSPWQRFTVWLLSLLPLAREL